MALTFSLIDTWDDGKRVHVTGTAAASGSYSTGGDTLELSQFPVIPATQAPTNVLAERVSYQFGTNCPGSGFWLTKLAPWTKPNPFAIVRGTN